MNKQYLAHSLKDKWHFLDDHLKDTATRAKAFADSFSAGEWAYLAGLWHDLGKYSDEFQERLNGGKRVDHATAGAQHAFQKKAKKSIATPKQDVDLIKQRYKEAKELEKHDKRN